MDHAGHRERLRNRYKMEGLSGFAPHEVLELLLTYAIPRADTNGMAHELMEKFGSLHGVLEAAPEELEEVEGIGPRASALISMMVPLMRYYEQDQLLPRLRVNTYGELAAYCRTLFLGAHNEKMYLLCFDARLKLLATELIAEGTPVEVNVIPRLVVQQVIRHHAMGVVITHNHPSGSPEPSQEDVELTEKIQALLQGIDVRLHDHIIVAWERTMSLYSRGFLDDPLPDAVEQEDLAAERPQHQLPARKKRSR